MKNTIEQLIKQHGGKATNVISRNSQLLVWIEENCDKNCKTLRQKIYTALYNVSILCPCGSNKLRSVKTNFSGLTWCGTNGKCSKATEEIQNKIVKTCEERYGCTNVFQSIETKKKRAATMISKYGDESPIRVPFLREKINSTMIDKYGVPWATMPTEIEQKVSQTMRSKWGSHYAQRFFSEDTKSILDNAELLKNEILLNGFQGAAEKLQCSISFLHCLDRKYQLNISDKFRSDVEREISLWLTSNNIPHIINSQKIIAPKELDFYFPENNFAIEFQGDYWHGNPKIFKATDKIKSNRDFILVSEVWERDAHKQKLCEEKGIELVCIWESDWNENKEVIKSMILEKLKN